MVHWTRLHSALYPNGDWDGTLAHIINRRTHTMNPLDLTLKAR
jgi:hypothetical protein